MDDERTCTGCRQTKPLEQFQQYVAQGVRGYRRVCILCFREKWGPVTAAHGKRYYHENHADIRTKAQERATKRYGTPEGKVAQLERNALYRERHPEKELAKRAVQKALRSGKLVRQACEICGCIAVQAHHEDYARQLDVRWLCREHHSEAHRLLNRSGARSGMDPVLDGVEWHEFPS